MQLLWGGIAAYVFHYEIALMFGCASLPGTDPDALAVPLSYLRHAHLAPPELRPRAVAERYVEMRRLDAAALDIGRIRATLPPLIKGYLRLGGFVGEGAVIDSSSTRPMSASWSRRTSSPRSIRATTRTVKEPWSA